MFLFCFHSPLCWWDRGSTPHFLLCHVSVSMPKGRAVLAPEAATIWKSGTVYYNVEARSRSLTNCMCMCVSAGWMTVSCVWTKWTCLRFPTAGPWRHWRWLALLFDSMYVGGDPCWRPSSRSNSSKDQKVLMDTLFSPPKLFSSIVSFIVFRSVCRSEVTNPVLAGFLSN